MDLEYLTDKFTKCLPNATHDELVGFLNACCDLHEHPPYAQDSSPIPLDPDLVTLAQGAPSNIVQQIYAEQAERNSYRPLEGGSAMPFPTRPSRDEDVVPQGSRGMVPRGGMSPMSIDQDDPDRDDPGAQMTPETLIQFVEMCANRLAANDDEGLSHNNFMNMLGQMVANAHQNGMVNGNGNQNGTGDRARKRAAGDNGNSGTAAGRSTPSPGTGRSTPSGGISNFNGRGTADRKRAMDSSIAVRNINHKSFLKRFPEAKHISIRG